MKMGDSYELKVIGYIRSSLEDRASAPRQGRDAGVEAEIEVLPEFESALNGIESHRNLMVLCWLHLAERNLLQVHPKRDPDLPLTGVFSTRSPARPNPLAVYTVEMLGVKGNAIKVRGLDAVDGTPVVDIKPHIHRLDD
jgi:L-fuculose-phosphate aldolase